MAQKMGKIVIQTTILRLDNQQHQIIQTFASLQSKVAYMQSSLLIVALTLLIENQVLPN